VPFDVDKAIKDDGLEKLERSEKDPLGNANIKEDYLEIEKRKTLPVVKNNVSYCPKWFIMKAYKGVDDRFHDWCVP